MATRYLGNSPPRAAWLIRLHYCRPVFTRCRPEDRTQSTLGRTDSAVNECRLALAYRKSLLPNSNVRYWDGAPVVLSRLDWSWPGRPKTSIGAHHLRRRLRWLRCAVDTAEGRSSRMPERCSSRPCCCLM